MLLVCNPAPKPDFCGVCGCVLYVFPSAIDAMIHNSPACLRKQNCFPNQVCHSFAEPAFPSSCNI